MSRVEDKKGEIESFLGDLKSIMPSEFEDYISNLEKRLACERALEKIIEVVGDLAILIIKEKRFEMPSDDIRAFDVLVENGVISDVLGEKLRRAKGMRNFLAHQYGKINDEVVFEVMKDRIFEDVGEFLSGVS